MYSILAKCLTEEWACDSGQCLPPDQVCNNKVECDDGSDESDKTCGREPCKITQCHKMKVMKSAEDQTYQSK